MLSNSRSRYRRALAAAATAATLVAVAMGAAAPASALSTKTLVISKLAEADLTPPAPTSGMVVDPVSQRGFIANPAEKSVQVFDLSGGSFIKTTTITAGLSAPSILLVDRTNRKLYVGESVSKVSVIDIDPASGSAYTVIASLGLSGRPEWMAVDEARQRLLISGQSTAFVQVFALPAGTSANVPAKVGRKPMAVDQATGTAYFTMGGAGDAIVSLRRDGSTSVHPVTDPAGSVAFAGGKLVVTGTSLSVIDPLTWAIEASHPVPEGSPVTTLTVIDEKLGRAYVSSQASPMPTEILTFPGLAKDGSVALPTLFSSMTVDPATRRIITTAGMGKITMYSVEPRPKPVVERVDGADRYVVSAKASAGRFGPMAAVAYVASGDGFADALSASAVAGAEGGPVLLIKKDAIPRDIRDELTRLKPKRIVVVGGTSTISDETARALTEFSTDVKRIDGGDRYVVSATASRGTFGTARPVAYIASGETFPDALSGSAAAGRLGGPVLLTKKDELPADVAAELTRLAPAKIVVLGGTSTISASVLAQAGKASPKSQLTRTGGADRYVVSATIANDAFSAETPVVYVASGEGFPDALSGSAAAIASASPVLLVTKDTVPAAIDSALDRLLPSKIIVLGGASTISPGVLDTLRDH
jgi:putative cell wall-binding protein